MSNWNYPEYLKQILGAKNSADVAALQFDEPGFIDKRLGGASDADLERLYKLQAAQLDQLQRNEAAPLNAEAARLKLMAAQDPETIGSTEGLQDFAARPEYWLGQSSDGITPGKKPATTTGNNPYIAQALQSFAVDNQNQADMVAALKGDRVAAARLAMQEKIPQQFHQTAQGLDQISNVDKRDGERAQADTSAADLSKFQTEIAKLGGGTTRETAMGPYADPLQAFQVVSVGRDPQSRPFNRIDNGGGLMPFEELAGRVQQAAADNPNVPREVVKNVLDGFRVQYENSGETTSGKVGRTTFQKWTPALGKPIITKEDVQPAPSRISINNGNSSTPTQIESWVAQIRSGNATLKDIPARGNIRNQVVEYITQNHPEANMSELSAGKKWRESQGAAQTLALVDATAGILEDMRKVYPKLNKTGAPLVNFVQDKYQQATGNADRSEYMSLKNYGIQEVEKMLSGSGAMSDHRIKLAFDNLKETNTPEQFERSIRGIQKVMAEREKATREGPYQGDRVPVNSQAAKKADPMGIR